MSISRESIRIIPPTEYSCDKLTHYEWTCPDCGDTVHGDSRSDTIFEIRYDPICVTCRIKLGQVTFDGATYRRVPQVEWPKQPQQQ